MGKEPYLRVRLVFSDNFRFISGKEHVGDLMVVELCRVRGGDHLGRGPGVAVYGVKVFLFGSFNIRDQFTMLLAQVLLQLILETGGGELLVIALDVHEEGRVGPGSDLGGGGRGCFGASRSFQGGFRLTFGVHGWRPRVINSPVEFVLSCVFCSHPENQKMTIKDNLGFKFNVLQ